MTKMANESRSIGLENWSETKQTSTNLISGEGLHGSLIEGGHMARISLVESHIAKTLAFQIRSLREREAWTQEELGEKVGMNQNAIYRLENPRYGKPTVTTLKRIAAAFDVALTVRFVPFSYLEDWISGTPRLERGLSPSAFAIPSFTQETETGAEEVAAEHESEIGQAANPKPSQKVVSIENWVRFSQPTPIPPQSVVAREKEGGLAQCSSRQ